MASVSLSRRRPTARRVATVLIAVLAASAAVAIAAARPVQGQAAPPTFSCDGGLYVVTGSPRDMTLTRVDQTDGALTPIGGGGLTANALAHNPADDYLYGMSRDDPHEVVRVHADGTQISLGPAVGTPDEWELTYVGAFLENGRYLVLGDTVPAGTPDPTPALWAEIDVSTSPPSVVRTFSDPSVRSGSLWDVAVSPVDGHLYGYSLGANRVVRIDPDTGAASPVGPTLPEVGRAGSDFFDSFGRLWLYGSRAGSTVQDTLFRIDDVFAGDVEVVGSGPAVSNSDGASCPFSVGMEKTADPTAVCAGDHTTFTLTITNESPNGAPITADLVDRLDGGRTFVPGSLVNPFGGQVNDYGGTDELTIDDLTLPGDTSEAITVDVTVPPDQAPGTFTNQAALTDLSGDVGPAVLSEYPATPQLPDPTPVTVVNCADLGVAKTAEAPTIGPGTDVAYTVRVTNHGPSDATGIDSLADVVPAGTEYVAASGGGGLSPFATVVWPAFDLAVGEHRDVGVTLRGTASVLDHTDGQGRLVNVVTVDHPGDPDPDNDTDRAAVPAARPDLSVDKDDGVDTVTAGDETTYEIVATNHGAGAALGAVLSDELPEGTTFVAASSGGTLDGRTVTWSGIDLDPDESQTMTVTVRVEAGLGAGSEITNVAVLRHDDDADPTDNRDADTDTITGPDDPIADPDPATVTRRPDPPRPAEPTGFLPVTGGDAVTWTWVAAALLGLGGAAWVAANNTRNP